MTNCNNTTKITGVLYVPNARYRDFKLVMEGKHPKFKSLDELIRKVNTDKRYKHKFGY